MADGDIAQGVMEHVVGLIILDVDEVAVGAYGMGNDYFEDFGWQAQQMLCGFWLFADES